VLEQVVHVSCTCWNIRCRVK